MQTIQIQLSIINRFFMMNWDDWWRNSLINGGLPGSHGLLRVFNINIHRQETPVNILPSGKGILRMNGIHGSKTRWKWDTENENWQFYGTLLQSKYDSLGRVIWELTPLFCDEGCYRQVSFPEIEETMEELEYWKKPEDMPG